MSRPMLALFSFGCFIERFGPVTAALNSSSVVAELAPGSYDINESRFG